eukprot:TRINITY_DN7828_c0_g1_i1.p1 TRINITY_DN7828_c0_g1~~TRINITY_DN7828_c0_g1_i1.p1  ORF type:complete len:526 (+),score=106.70 TRINITY_DN7828_c0_g1_i1:93-1670(+)
MLRAVTRLSRHQHRHPALLRHLCTASMFDKAHASPQSTALVADGVSYTYGTLLRDSATMAHRICGAVGKEDLNQAHVGFLADPGYEYVVTQWAVWRAGGCAVPLCNSHPADELEYTLSDANCELALATSGKEELLSGVASKIGTKFEQISCEPADEDRCSFPELPLDRRAMIIYTSGTTGRPKGVVSTHGGLQSQITGLCEAWEWSSDDTVLHTLPLHHVHGVVNVLGCALYSGATCEFMYPFSGSGVWGRLGSGDFSLFMAVPTIYHKLIQEYEDMDAPTQAHMSAALKPLRLMVSGSAALPPSVMQKWEAISGHKLLERYGMTETGMILSNPYHGERIRGTVGYPLPGVTVKVDGEEDGQGELLVKGDNLFQEYWGRPEQTAAEFTEDGWFKTGDIVECVDGRFSIKGRASVDILKTGGYKVSALDVEEQLLQHDNISQVAVFGVDDEQWGQKIAAVVVLAPGSEELQLGALRSWGKEKMASYRIPSLLKVVGEIPKNAMGKVNKKQLALMYAQDQLLSLIHI